MNKISRQLLKIAREINALENTKWTKVGEVWEASMIVAQEEYLWGTSDNWDEFKDWFINANAHQIQNRIEKYGWGLGNYNVTNLFIFCENTQHCIEHYDIQQMVKKCGGSVGMDDHLEFNITPPQNAIKLDKYTILTPEFYFCCEQPDFENDFCSCCFGKKYEIYWNGKKMQEFEDALDYYKLQEIK